MQWLSKSLTRKFASGTAAGLLASSLFFLILFMSLYRGQLEREQRVAADQVGRLVQASLHGLLREGDLTGLNDTVKQLTEEQGVLGITIADGDGRIRVASDSTAVGQFMAPPREHRLGAGLELIDGDTPAAVLRSFNPIAAPLPDSDPEPGIGASLGLESGLRAESPMPFGHVGGQEVPEGQPVDEIAGGTLYVDFDATPIRLKARTTTLLLMGSGALIVLVNLAGGWWFMRRPD